MSTETTTLKGHSNVVEQDAACPVKYLPESYAAPDATFIASVQNYGVLSPVILVVQDPSKQRGEQGRYKVVDGLRRLAAARIVGLATVPVAVYDMEPMIGDVSTVMLNGKRSENHVAELAAVERVMSHAIGTREIAKATGIAAGKIDKLLKYRLLIMPLKARFDSYSLPQNLAYKIVSTPALLKDEAQEAVEQRLEELAKGGEKLTVKWLDALAGKKRDEPPSFDKVVIVWVDLKGAVLDNGGTDETLKAVVDCLSSYGVEVEVPEQEEAGEAAPETPHVAPDLAAELEGMEDEPGEEEEQEDKSGAPPTISELLSGYVRGTENLAKAVEGLKACGISEGWQLKEHSVWWVQQVPGIGEATAVKLHEDGVLHDFFDLGAAKHKGPDDAYYAVGQIVVKKQTGQDFGKITRFASGATGGPYVKKDGDGDESQLKWRDFFKLFWAR